MYSNDLFTSEVLNNGLSQPMVPDLRYVDDFVTVEEASRIVSHIDASTWIIDLRRRVQHYGFKYDYKVRSIDESMRVDPLPPWAKSLGNRLVKRGLFADIPNQVIVNEYLPGQGIAAHVDCVPCFGDTVASVSFLSPCLMSFERVKGSDVVDLDLQPSSVVLLAGEARFGWKHGIAGRMSDRIHGVSRPRGRRISATFRTVILKQDRASRRQATTPATVDNHFNLLG